MVVVLMWYIVDIKLFVVMQSFTCKVQRYSFFYTYSSFFCGNVILWKGKLKIEK